MTTVTLLDITSTDAADPSLISLGQTVPFGKLWGNGNFSSVQCSSPFEPRPMPLHADNVLT